MDAGPRERNDAPLAVALTLVVGLLFYVLVRAHPIGLGVDASALRPWTGFVPSLLHTTFIGFGLAWADRRRPPTRVAAWSAALGIVLEAAQLVVPFWRTSATFAIEDVAGCLVGALITFGALRRRPTVDRVAA